jgi:hypothetical protein
MGVITEEKHRQLIDRLTDERFIGAPLPPVPVPTRPQLPANKELEVPAEIKK